MIRLSNSSRAVVSALISLVLSLCLCACEIPPTQPGTGLLDIQPAAQQDNPNEAEAQTDPPTADTPVGALIHRIDLPLDVSMDTCWEAVDESMVPLRTHGMWQANGLRIGILSAEDAPAFADSLPTIQGESRAKLIGSPYPSSVRSTPRLIRPVTVDLTDPPKSLNIVQARGGRLQLLAKITRDESGQAYLELTPHHYKPKADLIPRNPIEKQLDGQVFTALTARLPLTPNTAVIVGLHRPWPEVEEAEEAASDSAEAVEDEVTDAEATTTPESMDATNVDDPAASSDQPSELTDQPASPQPPAIPNHLGKAQNAGKRAGHKTQVVLVISIIEDWQ